MEEEEEEEEEGEDEEEEEEGEEEEEDEEEEEEEEEEKEEVEEEEEEKRIRRRGRTKRKRGKRRGGGRIRGRRGRGRRRKRRKYFKMKYYKIRGSFQNFCTLFVFSLKMNIFHKIHLQAFNVISIVLYHSGPTFGQVLYSCQDAFVVDASYYSGHLIRHLSASEAFHTEWFLQFWEHVKGRWAHVRTVRRVGRHLPSILFQNFRYCT